MEYLILVVVCAVVLGYLILRQKRKEPEDTYVCAVCGEKDCVCHKVEKK